MTDSFFLIDPHDHERTDDEDDIIKHLGDVGVATSGYAPDVVEVIAAVVGDC